MATQGTAEAGEMNRAERERRRKAIAYAKSSGADNREVARWFGVTVAMVYEACHEFRDEVAAISQALARKK